MLLHNLVDTQSKRLMCAAFIYLSYCATSDFNHMTVALRQTSGGLVPT